MIIAHIIAYNIGTKFNVMKKGETIEKTRFFIHHKISNRI